MGIDRLIFFISELLSKTLGFLQIYLLSHSYTPTDYGQFRYLILVGLFYYPLTDLGLSNASVREVASKRYKPVEYLAYSWTLKSLIALSIMLVGVIYISVTSTNSVAYFWIVFLALWTFSIGIDNTCSGLFVSQERFRLESFFVVLRPATVILCVLLAQKYELSIRHFMIMFIGASLLYSLTRFFIAMKLFGKFAMSIQRLYVKFFLVKESISFSLLFALIVAVPYLVPLLTKTMLTYRSFVFLEAANIFNVKFRLVATTLAWIYYPVFSRLLSIQDPGISLFKRVLLKVGLLALITSGVIFWFGDSILMVIYPGEYSSAASLCRHMFFLPILIGININLVCYLSAARMNKHCIKIFCYTLIAQLCITPILIKFFEINGSVMALIATELILLLLLSVQLKRRI